MQQEEPKQETLEEAAENYGWRIKTNSFSDKVKANELAESSKQDFIEGAKWQQEKYEALLKEFEQYKRESIKWSVEDFTEYDHPRYTISEDQAQEALERMIQKHDACYGISWETVEYYVVEYGTLKEEKL